MVGVVSGTLEFCEEGKAYRAISVLDSLDLDIVDLDHLPVEAYDSHHDADDGVAVLGLLILELERIAELQVLLVTFESGLWSGRFLYLRSEKQAWHLLHGNRIERSPIQRQVVVLGGKVHDEIALDIVRPFVHAIPFSLEGEGARNTV